jgi:hypothetical protein
MSKSGRGRLQQIYNALIQKLGKVRRPEVYSRLRARTARKMVFLVLATLVILVITLAVIFSSSLDHPFAGLGTTFGIIRPEATPTPFNPSIGAVLPTHRVVAFYAVPGAEATGPAYELTPNMLNNLKDQGAAYQQLDPGHPVQLGIDLVTSVPDRDPGPVDYYSHNLDRSTIQSYIDFCQKNGLILFLDLNIGQAPVMDEVNFFLPYLEHYTFVNLAIDPEWMFPRHNGIPGIDLSNVRASDLNPIIQAVAEIPMKYHVPRKILLIHQYRNDGDDLNNPYNPGQAEIADKRDLLNDPRVDLVIHVDSVGGYLGDQLDKTQEYENWVGQDMQKYHNFRYGGFKLFYHIEAQTLMTPKQVMALTPAPMVVTYGN